MCSTHSILTRSAAALGVLAVLGPAVRADDVKTDVVRGLVVRADSGAKQITVRPAAGPDVTLAVTDASQLRVGAKGATVGDVKQGQRVRVTYTLRAGMKEIVVLRPAVTTTADLQRELKRALDATKTYTFQQKEWCEAELREVVSNLGDRIDHLRAEAKDAKADVRQRAEAEIARLEKQRDALNDRLATIRSATAETWEDVRGLVGKAVKDLEETLNDLLKP